MGQNKQKTKVTKTDQFYSFSYSNSLCTLCSLHQQLIVLQAILYFQDIWKKKKTVFFLTGPKCNTYNMFVITCVACSTVLKGEWFSGKKSSKRNISLNHEPRPQQRKRLLWLILCSQITLHGWVCYTCNRNRSLIEEAIYKVKWRMVVYPFVALFVSFSHECTSVLLTCVKLLHFSTIFGSQLCICIICQHALGAGHQSIAWLIHRHL